MSEGNQGQVAQLVDSAKKFAEQSKNFVSKCEKPDFKEYKKTALACAVGFAVMGFVGYIIKLVFIPINNIILNH